MDRTVVVPAPVQRMGTVLPARTEPVPGTDLPTRLARRDSRRRRLLALLDVFAIVCGLAIAGTDQLLLATVPLWIVALKLAGLYDRDDKVVHKSTLDELPRLLQTLTLGSLLLFMFAPAALSRAQTATLWVSVVVLVPLLRTLGRWAVARTLEPERCVIVGSGLVAAMLARKVEANPQHHLELVGFVDDETSKPPLAGAPAELLGSLKDFEAICALHRIDRVLVAFSDSSHHGMIEAVRLAKRAGIRISVVPRLYEVIGHNVQADQVEGMTLLTLRGFSRSRSSLLIKRAIDVVGAGLALLVMAPVMAAIALAVKLTSPGPVLYSAERVGRGRTFRMHKFRSMVAGADAAKHELRHLNEADGPMFKIAGDPRITPVGRFLRRTSLDELPQLLNVLRGEMSLVGPRPLVPDEDDHIVGLQRTRLDLTPGLTGPWQVAGRTKVPFYEMLTMDYLYVAEWSLYGDIKLLLRTLPVVLFARGS